MMLFPKLKKTVQSFLLDESGSISKKGIFAIGCIGVLALSSEVEAATKQCVFSATCDAGFVGGPVTRTVKIVPECTSSWGDDSCSIKSYTGDKEFVPDYESWKAGDNVHAEGTLSFSDLGSHQNSLSISSESDVLIATHDHALMPGFTGCDVQFYVHGNDDPIGTLSRSGYEPVECIDRDCDLISCDVALGCTVSDSSKVNDVSKAKHCNNRNT